MSIDSLYLRLLENHISLKQIPFTDRDARLLLFQDKSDESLWVGLAEYETDPEERAPISCWRFTGEHGHPLSGIDYTPFPHQVTCQTAAGMFQIAFADRETLLVSLPSGRCGITFQTPLSDARIDLRGGVLRQESPSPCFLAYTTNAKLLQNEVVASSTGVQEVRLRFEASEDCALLLTITRAPGFTRFVPKPVEVLDAAARRWHAWFAAAPPVAEIYQRHYYYAWWVMGINLLYPYAYPKREGMVPSKLGYVGIWHWDSYFHALALRHSDIRLARDQLRIMLDHQQDNGMIPDVVHDEGVLAHTIELVEADITKPPLTAWAAWKLYEIDGECEFLREVYEPIVRSQNWWFAECDLDGNGLCEYLHPWSSGLDNNPMWDYGLPVESPDLNAYLCLQYDYLSKIATALGRDEEASQWAKLASQLIARLIELRWDARDGLFWAARHGERIPVRTPFNLFPLITGRLPAPIAERLVSILTDEEQFWGYYPVPTVAFNDPRHDPQVMWRGPVWLNVNYLLIDGLQRAGYGHLARELRERTLALALAADDFYEYYHPLTGAKPPRATHAFGWSAALFIDLAIAASTQE